MSSHENYDYDFAVTSGDADDTYAVKDSSGQWIVVNPTKGTVIPIEEYEAPAQPSTENTTTVTNVGATGGNTTSVKPNKPQQNNTQVHYQDIAQIDEGDMSYAPEDWSEEPVTMVQAALHNEWLQGLVVRIVLEGIPEHYREPAAYLATFAWFGWNAAVDAEGLAIVGNAMGERDDQDGDEDILTGMDKLLPRQQRSYRFDISLDDFLFEHENGLYQQVRGDNDPKWTFAEDCEGATCALREIDRDAEGGTRVFFLDLESHPDLSEEDYQSLLEANGISNLEGVPIIVSTPGWSVDNSGRIDIGVAQAERIDYEFGYGLGEIQPILIVVNFDAGEGININPLDDQEFNDLHRADPNAILAGIELGEFLNVTSEINPNATLNMYGHSLGGVVITTAIENLDDETQIATLSLINPAICPDRADALGSEQIGHLIIGVNPSGDLANQNYDSFMDCDAPLGVYSVEDLQELPYIQSRKKSTLLIDVKTSYPGGVEGFGHSSPNPAEGNAAAGFFSDAMEETFSIESWIDVEARDDINTLINQRITEIESEFDRDYMFDLIWGRTQSYVFEVRQRVEVYDSERIKRIGNCVIDNKLYFNPHNPVAIELCG